MNGGPFSLRQPSGDALRALIRAARDESPSYPEVGASLGVLPDGYHHVQRHIALGNGEGTFERAVAGIRHWAPHTFAGVSLLPATPAIVEGTTLLLAFRSFPFHVTAACRIVAVIDEADQFGFAYGSLPHHPEQGEESFLVMRSGTGSGEVRFFVRAFSRPGHVLTTLGGPIGRAVQARVTRKYLLGLKAATDGAPAQPSPPG